MAGEQEPSPSIGTRLGRRPEERARGKEVETTISRTAAGREGGEARGVGPVPSRGYCLQCRAGRAAIPNPGSGRVTGTSREGAFEDM